MNKQQERILKLKKEHGVILFAHYYQRPEIQEIADIIGDSLFLAKEIKKLPENSKIIYAAVKFMAETGKVLNPSSKIYFPLADIDCPMALYGYPEMLKEFKEEHPDIPIILYINSTTETKQYADVVCTSSSGEKIVKYTLDEWNTDKFAFSPDRNLGRYIQKQLGIPDENLTILPTQGHCFVHEQFKVEHIADFKTEYGINNVKIIVHPECTPDVVKKADYVGSTKGLLEYIADNHDEILSKRWHIGVGTEVGLVDYIHLNFPDMKELVLPLFETPSCNTMKIFTLDTIEKILNNLDDESIQVHLDPKLIEKVAVPIKKMMDITK